MPITNTILSSLRHALRNIRNSGCFLFLLIVLMFDCCRSNNKAYVNNSTARRQFLSNELVDSLLNQERICIDKKERIISYVDTIEDRGEINQIFVEKDTITYTEDFKGRRRITLFNNDSLRKYALENSEFNIDSMNLALDLNELEICYLKSNDDIVVIIIKPMNWVGKMTRFSFFQLINSKEKTVVEFIKKDA